MQMSVIIKKIAHTCEPGIVGAKMAVSEAEASMGYNGSCLKNKNRGMGKGRAEGRDRF